VSNEAKSVQKVAYSNFNWHISSHLAIFTYHFSGPHTLIGPVCVSVLGQQTITFEQKGSLT